MSDRFILKRWFQRKVLLRQNSIFVEIFERERGYQAVSKALTLAKSISTGNSKSFFFFCDKQVIKPMNDLNLNWHDSMI